MICYVFRNNFPSENGDVTITAPTSRAYTTPVLIWKKNSPWVIPSYSIKDNVNLDEKQDAFVLPEMTNSKDDTRTNILITVERYDRVQYENSNIYYVEVMINGNFLASWFTEVTSCYGSSSVVRRAVCVVRCPLTSSSQELLGQSLPN